jgi:hypothetical protein
MNNTIDTVVHGLGFSGKRARLFASRRILTLTLRLCFLTFVKILFFFFLISNCNLLKSAKGCNPYTRKVYKRTPKMDEQRINLKSLHK